MGFSSSTRASLPIAGLAAIAIVTACGDSSGPRSALSTQEATDIGLAVASEVELSIASMLARDVIIDFTGAFPLAARRAAARPLPRTFGESVAPQTDCGSPSQNPIVDSDGDRVPDDVTFTFTLPDCHFAQGTESLDLTGAVRFLDPEPQTAGFSFNSTFTAFRLAFSGVQGSGVVTRNGVLAVSASESGLAESHNMSLTAAITGEPDASFQSIWTSSFVLAAGSVIQPEQPLPSGTLSAAGNFSYSRGSDDFAMVLVTSTPLQYDTSCAAETPFRAGEIHAVLAGNNARGYVRVRYANCSEPNVTFVAENR